MENNEVQASVQSDHTKESVCALVGGRLSLAAFHQLSGNLAGYPFVKLVVDRAKGEIHFINNAAHDMHGDYIVKHFFKKDRADLERNIDKYNQGFYHDPKRDLYLGILSLHTREEKTFFALETVEIDTMDGEMVSFLYDFVSNSLAGSMPLLLKPANHLQEAYVASIDSKRLPRVLAHELFSTSAFIPLNPATAKGRLRVFYSLEGYEDAKATIQWYDIVVMEKVPDDIPRLSGMINAKHTTPLSHTNVLATGWHIPNCIQIGIFERIEQASLDGRWVEYTVDQDADDVSLVRIERPPEIDTKPAWKSLRVQIEAPDTDRTPVVRLDQLRGTDRYKYGTKAANLGELSHLIANGSDRLIGFYRIQRPPRANLLPQLAKLLGVPSDSAIDRTACEFLRDTVQVPRGIAIPFSLQRNFLESSPSIQQGIGRLKMALELEAPEADSICISLQRMIRSTRMPEKIRSYIDSQIAKTLAGVSSFVVRSSSNAEDLEGFSAAGIYESINHVTRAEMIFEAIKRVWASLLSPRSVRLRQEVGIALEDCYMGVIIQEEAPSYMGGVLVTANPMKRDDFRNVYLNVSTQSVNEVVSGNEQPYQYLINIIEGGGRTLSIGAEEEDLSDTKKDQLQKRAVAGRLRQSHFSPDYTFATPVDIEWLAHEDGIHIVQLRPYSQ